MLSEKLGKCYNLKNNETDVVYFNQLSGAAYSQKLVELLRLNCFFGLINII